MNVLSRNNIYRRMIDELQEGLCFADRDLIIRTWNSAAESITGYTADEVIGSSCADGVLTCVDEDGEPPCSDRCPLARTIKDGTSRVFEGYLMHKQGFPVRISFRISAVHDDDGNIVGGMALFSKIRLRLDTEAGVGAANRVVLLDDLTFLANRIYLKRELEAKLSEHNRFDTPFGLLYVDVDHFRKFNNAHGAVQGDKALRLIAQTFVAGSRTFDVYGRWGGEEFLGIIRNIDGNQLMNLGNRLRTQVEGSYIRFDGNLLRITISIGATLSRPEDTIESIVDRAEKLMLRSKSEGRNRVTFG